MYCVQLAHRVDLYLFDHFEEEFETFSLILSQRVFLSVAPEADPFLQMVEGEEMLFPVGVKRMQGNETFQRPDFLFPKFLLLLLVDGQNFFRYHVEEAFPGDVLEV